MAVEGSKWCDQVTSQTKMAKTNVESRVEEASRFENSLQLEFKPEIRLQTANFYSTRHQTGGPN